ncbi:hypothetical protein HID58_023958 [Brassica napus]|uniref:Uncharacterized protein n=1 Tax=Brassica napus TaxID=3708 RepID=A0ABQ8D3L5_BRANA|nr:hypothetical protein HID58_023958 [Brassica napus]
MRADNDHVVGNSVESCKDESKPHQCPEEKWEDAELKIQENGKNGSNVPPELFYDTRTGDEWDKENDGKDSNEDGKNNIDAKSGSPEPVDPVFFMDKNVTACDLPEIVVCYNENTYYHVVKDICVDEGVPVQEKFLFGEKGSVKCSSDSNQCESEDLMKADKGIETIISSEEDRNGKVDDESELCNDPKTNQDVEESPREDFADAEGSSSSCNQDHLIVTREAKDSHEIEPFNDNQQPSLVVGDTLEDNKLISGGFGETSFSGAEAVSISGHITYTGPIAFSGSLSVRSDASTTSGRSFAFPVLQSEWNSSPVRMAKPEKRRHKGWRQILLCCRSS